MRRLRRVAYAFLIITLLLLFSCDVEILSGDENVNDHIYPYLEFKPDSTGGGYSVTVVDGANLENIYIPAEVEIDGNPVTVTTFDGFANPQDAQDLKTIVFESSGTIVTDKVIKETVGLVSIKIDKPTQNSVWGYLPSVEREGKHFLGWFIAGTSTQVFEGNVITNPVIEPQFNDHIFTSWTFDKAANKWTRTCTVCKKIEERNLNEHDLVHHAAVKETCTGNIEYWHCTVCGKYYSDEKAENEITQESTVISQHTLSDWDYDLDNHWKVCPVDGVVLKAEHSWGEWEEKTSGSVTHLFTECKICGARKVATKPEYLVYDIGIGEFKLKDIEDTPCGDFYVDGVKVESGSSVSVAKAEVTVEFRPYIGSNTDYSAYCFVINSGSIREIQGVNIDGQGNCKVNLELKNTKEYVLNLQINTGGGSLSFDCYLIFRK